MSGHVHFIFRKSQLFKKSSFIAKLAREIKTNILSLLLNGLRSRLLNEIAITTEFDIISRNFLLDSFYILMRETKLYPSFEIFIDDEHIFCGLALVKPLQKFKRK